MRSLLDFLDSVHLGRSGSAIKGITSSKEQRCGEVSRGEKELGGVLTVEAKQMEIPF